MGVGIDERTAVVIDRNGIGTLMLEHKGGSALFIRSTQARRIVPGQPFAVRVLSVTVLNRGGQQYDFNRHCADALTWTVDIDGSKPDLHAGQSERGTAGREDVEALARALGLHLEVDAQEELRRHRQVG